MDRRSWTEPLPWDYSARVAALARGAQTMLDMGTGGGEALSGASGSRAAHRRGRGMAPNVPLAHGDCCLVMVSP